MLVREGAGRQWQASYWNFSLDVKAHISDLHFESLQGHEVRANDVVVAMLGDALPRACIVPEHVGPAIVKADCVRLRVAPDVAVPRLVAAGLNSDVVRSQASELVHGLGRPRLGLRWFRTLKFRLAPLPEQHRIVEAIESYQSRLDDAVSTLERVQRNLKRYRASVLQAAVAGRLVRTEAELARVEGRSYEQASVLLERILEERRRQWSESGRKGKYEEPVAPDTSELPELPEGWCWATVDQVSSEVRYGSSSKTDESLTEGVPVIRMGNIVDGELQLDDLKYLPTSHPEFPDLLLRPGDLLFNRTNSAELVGKSAVLRNDVGPISFASYLIRVRFLQGSMPEFAAAFINAPAGRTWVASVAVQQVGQANVNGTKLKACLFPLAPVAEQIRIVAEMDRVLSVLRATAQVTMVNTVRCTRLRQSILKWAFEGKLADQDPNDEPASELLRRIQAERATAGSDTKNGGARRKRRSR